MGGESEVEFLSAMVTGCVLGIPVTKRWVKGGTPEVETG